MKKRFYKFDNLKAILIFLVVFGHFLELVEGHRLLYLTIYSFHMPLFLFISGYFARFNRKNVWSKMIYPYAAFQMLYTFFEKYLLGTESLQLTFVKPRWILWYLFALMVYHLMLPLFDTRSVRAQYMIVAGTVLVGLLAGYDKRLGYDFSAARIFTFMPFFLSGYYLSQNKVFSKRLPVSKTAYIILFFLSAFLIAIMIKVLSMSFITKKMLYGSYSYEAAGYTVQIKLLLYAFAGIWIAVFVMLMPDKRIPVLSAAGRFTMPVFLLHGFAVKLTGMYYDSIGEKLPFVSALALSLFMVALLGNRFTDKVFRILFTGELLCRRSAGHAQD